MDEPRLEPDKPGLPPSARNPGIDRLPGLSILLVVMHHTALRIPLEKGVLGDWLPQRFQYGIRYDGFESVFLFFVISGFLITSNSLARWRASCYPPVLAGAWALGRLVARFVSDPLERRLRRRAGASRVPARATTLPGKVSA